MDKRRKRFIKGWMNRAADQLERARDHLNAPMEFSECVQACQQCIELSVKSILFALKIEYSRGHGWDRQQFSSLAKRIRHAEFIGNVIAHNLDPIRLPRLLLLARFWAQFYLPAKYEFEIGHLPPTETLLDREEAALALRHAEECYCAASQMKYLSRR